MRPVSTPPDPNRIIAMLADPNDRAKLLDGIECNFREGFAGPVASSVLKMKQLHEWEPAEGRERLDQLAGAEYGIQPANFVLLVEQGMVEEVLELLSRDPLESPFQTVWLSHLLMLGQIELLRGNPLDGREPLLKEYEKAAGQVIRAWETIEEIAANLNGTDADWDIAMGVLTAMSPGGGMRCDTE